MKRHLQRGRYRRVNAAAHVVRFAGTRHGGGNPQEEDSGFQCERLWQPDSQDPPNRPFRFPYVLIHEDQIISGRDLRHQLWWFDPPIRVPPSGLPSNAILPVDGPLEQETLATLDRLSNGPSPPPSPQEEKKGTNPSPPREDTRFGSSRRWFRLVLPDTAEGRRHRQRMLEWWERLTNQCLGPRCTSNSYWDPLTDQCLVRTITWRPNSNVRPWEARFPTLEKRFPWVRQTPAQWEARRRERRWMLSYLIIYSHVIPKAQQQQQTGPELVLLGALRRTGGAASNPLGVFRFPYPIPVPHASEFQQDWFGVPDFLLPQLQGVIQEQQRINDPASLLTLVETNQMLTGMQEEIGEFMVLPTLALLQQSSKSSTIPGYAMGESQVRVLERKSLEDAFPTAILSACITERDPYDPEAVWVLAGFTRNLRLVVPEQPLKLKRARLDAHPIRQIENLGSSTAAPARAGGGREWMKQNAYFVANALGLAVGQEVAGYELNEVNLREEKSPGKMRLETEWSPLSRKAEWANLLNTVNGFHGHRGMTPGGKRLPLPSGEMLHLTVARWNSVPGDVAYITLVSQLSIRNNQDRSGGQRQNADSVILSLGRSGGRGNPLTVSPRRFLQLFHR